jgi:hypothetical protein
MKKYPVINSAKKFTKPLRAMPSYKGFAKLPACSIKTKQCLQKKDFDACPIFLNAYVRQISLFRQHEKLQDLVIRTSVYLSGPTFPFS